VERFNCEEAKMHIVNQLKETAEQELNFHQIRVAANPGMNAVTESVLYDMSILDSKSAALLTFISVVIAGLIFSLGLVDPHAPHALFIRGAIFIFLGLFAYSAWLDLRCLHALGPYIIPAGSDPEFLEKVYISEVATRRKKYALALYISESSFLLLMPFALTWGALSIREFFV
jgi:hypothetical protein